MFWIWVLLTFVGLLVGLMALMRWFAARDAEYYRHDWPEWPKDDTGDRVL